MLLLALQSPAAHGGSEWLGLCKHQGPSWGKEERWGCEEGLHPGSQQASAPLFTLHHKLGYSGELCTHAASPWATHGPCLGHIQPVFWGAETQVRSDTLQKEKSTQGGPKMHLHLPVDGNHGPDPALPEPCQQGRERFCTSIMLTPSASKRHCRHLQLSRADKLVRMKSSKPVLGTCKCL